MKARKNPKPVSIHEVTAKFATDEHCLEYVEQMNWPDGIIRCPTCGDKNVNKVRARPIPRTAVSGSTPALNRNCLSNSVPRREPYSLTPICRS